MPTNTLACVHAIQRQSCNTARYYIRVRRLPQGSTDLYNHFHVARGCSRQGQFHLVHSLAIQGHQDRVVSPCNLVYARVSRARQQRRSLPQYFHLRGEYAMDPCQYRMLATKSLPLHAMLLVYYRYLHRHVP